MRLTCTAATVACLLLPIQALAVGSQLDARDEPTVTGPLKTSAKQCRDSVQKFKRKIVAKGTICLWILERDPGSEPDQDLNHGILWAQSSVWTASDWCTTKVHTNIWVPPGLAIGATAPVPAVIGEKTDATVTLESQGPGNSGDKKAEPASVSASMVLYPGEVTRPSPSEPEVDGSDPAPTRVRLTWIGRQTKKVAFASGVEVSWPGEETTPPVKYGIRYPVEKTAC